MDRSPPLFTNKKFVFLVATFCCLLWGSAYPAIKNGYALFHIAADDIPSKMVFAGYRFLLAGLVLLLFAVASGKAIGRLKKSQYKQIAILGLTQTTLQYVFFILAWHTPLGLKVLL
uniref:Uncharacterized protein n=1 Tax=Yersinia enterocolitica W22703 TaxID=913028 RepID=F4N7S1_YEREN|nr:hypothetical protein YEW_FX24650 [Yersinia enterocolitica W22703]